MALGNWINRVDGVDTASANDINAVANAVVELEKNKLPDPSNAVDGCFLMTSNGKWVMQYIGLAEGSVF